MKRCFSLCWLAAGGVILICSCSHTPTQTPQASTLPTQTSSFSPSDTPVHTLTATLQPSATGTPSNWQVCSPLRGVPIEDLAGMITNPYHPPAPGKDDPHAGVDISDRMPGSQIAVAGRTVQAALAGTVAEVTKDRFPFGNSVLIETRLDPLPPGWPAKVLAPTAWPTIAPLSALTCPQVTPSAWEAQPSTSRSLYVLYAHLKNTPAVKAGDAIACGQSIGAVGQTGNALNPHLHLEVRAGPQDARPGSMSHYDSSATVAEMHSYCVWSVSGLFQLMDPMDLFK
jgi:murein DD-endopeptidase MepM/ murein hydrolase activator NlpD